MSEEISNNPLDGINDYSFSHDEVLLFAQANRIRFVQAVRKECGGDEGIVTLDPERQANYLRTLDQIAKQALDIQKLKQDKENNEAQNDIIATLIVESARKRNIQRSRENEQQSIVPNPSVLPKKELVPGEMHIGDRIENYQEYKIRTGQTESQDL